MRKLIASASVIVFAACGGPNIEESTDQAGPAVETMPAATVAPVVLSDVSTVFDPETATYRVAWTSVPEGAPLRIEVSSDPATPPGEGQLIGTFANADAFNYVVEGEPRERRYFTLIPEGGAPMKTATRLLPLEGGRNFRDLGGYETEDGRTVKWGTVFRSGVMSELTADDYGYLSSLGIQVVCDLRAADERASEPTNWDAGEIEYLTFADPVSDGMGFLSVLMEPDVTPERVADAMAEGYVGIAKDQDPAYTAMFDRLAAGETPLAFNCSAGKDRAGTGAALILTALGVPRQTVVADYALSETFVDYMAAFMGEEAREGMVDSPYAFLMQLPPEVVAPLMRSDPRYIEATFDALEAEYGSVMAFIQTELEVTDAELAAIRRNLLE